MIEIKITADTAPDALKELIELTTRMAATAMPQQEDVPAAPAKTGKGKAPVSVPTDPALADKPTDKDAPPWEEKQGNKNTAPADPVPSAPTYTIETIRAAGVKAAEVHGKDKVKAILTDLDVTGMTQLTKEQYPEFMRKLGELDA